MTFLKRACHGFVMLLSLAMIPSCIGGDSSIVYKISDAVGKDNLVPVVVIGSGPAGASAAVYTCRANLKTVVFEGDEPGGQLMKTSFVENWPGVKRMLGSQAVGGVQDQAKTFGAEFFADTVESVDVSSWPFVLSTRGGETLHAMSVIVATGADPRYLGIPGEQKYWGGGVSACAICDAPFYKDLEVVIVGGGDSAVEEAMQLASYAKKVTILVRKDSMRASQAMQDHLKGYPNIFVLYNVEVKEIIGDDTFVTSVRLRNNKTGEESNYATNGLFLAIGRIPNSKMFKGVLAMDNLGHIQVKGRTQETSVPGIFAAGDVADSIYRQAGVASGDGIKAGLDAERFLSKIGLNKLMTKKLEPSFFQTKQEGEEKFKLEQIDSLKEFKKKARESKKPLILDFYTQHCPSCLLMLPKLAKIAREFAETVDVFKVDAELAEDIVEKFSVFKVPCLIALKGGREVARYKKDMSYDEIFALFEKLSR